METQQDQPLPKPEKQLFKKWQSWVGIISAIVVLVGALTDLPKKLIETYQMLSPNTSPHYFYGRILDARNNPVVGAEVILQGQNGSAVTDDNGEFKFKVIKKAGTRVQVLVKHHGQIKYNGAETLPGPIIIKLGNSLR